MLIQSQRDRVVITVNSDLLRNNPTQHETSYKSLYSPEMNYLRTPLGTVNTIGFHGGL